MPKTATGKIQRGQIAKVMVANEKLEQERQQAILVN
jgi:acyl-coenzyme A synthetase/AMP-(fatty) acid ligase